MATNKEFARNIVNRLFHHKDNEAETLFELIIDGEIQEFYDDRKELITYLEGYENKYLKKVWSMVQWATK